jgi:uncharacterized membrane protein
MSEPAYPLPIQSQSRGKTLSRFWIVFFLLLYGVFIGLPFMAPFLMHIGWRAAGIAIYSVYSLLCHQLPERSFFLFGPHITYSLAEIQNTWQNTSNPLVLRQFIGIPEMGWKVAWSDRMVSMYTSIWLFGIIWWLVRRKIKPLPWWGLVLLVSPMLIDGFSHMVSDLAGIGQGFRDSNTWLVTLTSSFFLPSFYAGDAWGSFNSIMRLVTGVMFGLGVVWFSFPYLNQVFVGQLISPGGQGRD